MITKFTSILLILIPFYAFSQVLEDILTQSRLPYLKNSKLFQISSFDSSGGNSDFLKIQNGEMKVLANLQGPGVITRIWITISARDSYFLRRILLRMFWDEEQNPSVESPIGDFFGTGFEYKHFASQFIGMTSGGYYCYFPMPFRKSARIEVVNQTGMEIPSFYYHIMYQKTEQPLEQDVAYFHSQWRREVRTDTSKNYLILDAEGKGHFVGVTMSMQSYNNQLWFLEGDEMVYVDGEQFPSIYGTGTEDYFTSGWYFNKGEFSTPYHGLIIKDDKRGRIAAYRFHVGDAIPFKKSIRFTIEHGHNNKEIADYSSVAYWYQMEPHKKFPQMMQAPLRIPLRSVVPHDAIEAESLVPKNTSAKFIKQTMNDYGADWSNNVQLLIQTSKPGDEFELTIPCPYEGTYNLDLHYTKSTDYGNVDIFYNNDSVGCYDGYSNITLPGRKITLINLKSVKRLITLRFKVRDKDLRAINYNIGLDAFVLNPIRSYITQWWTIGPFPNPINEKGIRQGLDIVYPPEKEFSPEKSYQGVNNQIVKWELTTLDKNGAIQFYQKYNPFELVVAYATIFIQSSKDISIPFLLGSDDGIKVILNGKEIHKVLTVRIAQPDEDKLMLQLKKGWNSLLLKIENNLGGYQFYARIIDEDNLLSIKSEKK